MNAHFSVLGLGALLVACGSGGGGAGPSGDPGPERPSSTNTTPGDHVVGKAPETSVIAFEDVSGRVGIVGVMGEGPEPCAVHLHGSGSAWGDVDLDGQLDLFVTNHGGPNFLYRNEGDTNDDRLPDFVDVAGALGIQQAGHYSHSAALVDHDNDGDQDLYVTSLNRGNTLWKNQRVEDGVLSFEDVTAFAGVADAGRTITSAWGDLDRDGFLDFYLAKHATCLLDANAMPADRLYHSLGDGRFEDWTRYLCADRSRTCQDITGFGFTAAFVDHDNDGDPDIYLVNDAIHGGARNRHFRNDGPDGLGGWLLPEVSGQLGTNTRLNGMGLGVGDLNNDGWLDLAFSNIEESHVLLNRGDGSYSDITFTCGVFDSTFLLIGWGTAFFDADSDGWLDLFFANGSLYNEVPQPNTFMRNNGDLTFAEMSFFSGLAGERRGRNVSLADFDGDGYVDLFVGNLFQQPYLYHNLSSERRSTQGWLTVSVEGTRSNRDGIGTRLSLRLGSMIQTREITSGPGHGGGDQRIAVFGMGSAATGTLHVRWPSGIEQDHGLVSRGQRLHLIEP